MNLVCKAGVMAGWRMMLITGDKIKPEPLFKGFMLVELIFVLGIIVSITLFGFVALHKRFSQSLLKTSAQEMVSTLTWARRLAITKRKLHKVVFAVKRRQYWIEDEDGEPLDKVINLKEGIIFANPNLNKWGEEDGIVEGGFSDNCFVFYPQGTCEGGSIYLKAENQDSWYTVTLVPSTGKANLYEGKH